MSVNTCCYFIDLRTGCIIIALVTLINSVFSVFTDFESVEVQWYMVIGTALYGIAAVLLLIGIFKNHRRFFYSYLILQAISILATTLYVVVIGAILITHNGYEEGLTFYAIGSLTIAVYVYFYYVVYHFYEVLKIELPH